MMAAKISRDPSIPLAGNSAGSSPRRPADARHHPQISPTRLIYGRQETLLAQPFDLKNLQLRGEVITVAEHVARAPDNPVSLFSTSDNGVLIYGGPSWPKYQLTWHGRDGAREGSIGEPGRFYGLSLSPDEKRLALHRPTPPLGNYDIWTLDLASGIFSRVTTHP